MSPIPSHSPPFKGLGFRVWIHCYLTAAKPLFAALPADMLGGLNLLVLWGRHGGNACSGIYHPIGIVVCRSRKGEAVDSREVELASQTLKRRTRRHRQQKTTLDRAQEALHPRCGYVVVEPFLVYACGQPVA